MWRILSRFIAYYVSETISIAITRGTKVVTQVIFSLPEAISAEPEILGRVDPAVIGSLTGTVLTPSDDHSQSAREYWQMVEWEWTDPTDLEPPAELAFTLPTGEHIDWGWISSKPEYGVGINALLLSFDLETGLLDQDIHGWFDMLADWLQAYTMQVLMPQSVEKGIPSRSIQVWGQVNGSVKKIPYIVSPDRLTSPQWTLVTPTIWEASVRRSSTGDELPLNWQLLGDALRALRGCQPRRAVVEAFSSLEVTVRQAVRNRVELCGDQAVADIIIRRRNTLGPLLEMARNLGIALPESLTGRLVELRNSVIHSGSLPSMTDALTVWQAAHVFAQQQSPLSLTLSGLSALSATGYH